jgi:hypothetical protein
VGGLGSGRSSEPPAASLGPKTLGVHRAVRPELLAVRAEDPRAGRTARACAHGAQICGDALAQDEPQEVGIHTSACVTATVLWSTSATEQWRGMRDKEVMTKAQAGKGRRQRWRHGCQESCGVARVVSL